MCKSGEVEDEVHFLIQCEAYNEQRKTLLDKISFNNVNGSSVDRFCKIMKPVEKCNLEYLGKYILECSRKRKTEL